MGIPVSNPSSPQNSHFITYPHTSSCLVIKTHYASEHLSTNTVYPHHLPHRLSVHSIICLLQIHERNPHFPFLFLHFLANLPQDKNLIRAAPSFPKPTLLFSNLPFTIFNHSLYQNSPIHFSRDR